MEKIFPEYRYLQVGNCRLYIRLWEHTYVTDDITCFRIIKY